MLSCRCCRRLRLIYIQLDELDTQLDGSRGGGGGGGLIGSLRQSRAREAALNWSCNLLGGLRQMNELASRTRGWQARCSLLASVGPADIRLSARPAIVSHHRRQWSTLTSTSPVVVTSQRSTGLLWVRHELASASLPRFSRCADKIWLDDDDDDDDATD